MGSLLNDLKFGARALFKMPGSVAIAVLTLTLGIGLSTISFSLIYGVFVRGLDVPQADRLVIVFRNNPSEDRDEMRVSQHDFFDWREQQQSFEGIAGFLQSTVNLSGTEGPQRYRGGFVSANAFDLLRVRPLLGSTFRQGDDLPGAPLTVILGYRAWETRYEANPNVIGQAVTVNGEPATIIGVMEEGFAFPVNQELWVPLRDQRAEFEARGQGDWFGVFGRLKDGTSREQAELDLALITQRLAQEYPETNEGVGATFRTFVEEDTGPELIAVFSAMQLATIFVLLIACANVANLLLARAALRTKEAAVRSALGANRWRVIAPFFSEALILAVGGAVLGLGIAYLGVSLFDDATTGVGKPYYMEFAIDLPILAFVIAITGFTALVAGVAPALQISKTDVNAILKDGARGSAGLHAGKLSKTLVVGEIALSCALLVVAGLMIKSIVLLRDYDLDFATENIFTARMGLFEADYPDREARSRFFRDLEERLEGIPGTQSVALAGRLPISEAGGRNLAIEGETYATNEDYPTASTTSITPNFFRTIDAELLRGRSFTVEDNAAAQEVAIVNQRFAERFFPGGDAIGKRIREGRSDSENEWKLIVGVAPNLKMAGLDATQDSAGYWVPLAQRDQDFVSIMIQVQSGSALALTPAVREAVRSIDPNLPIFDVFTLDGVLRNEIWFVNVFGTLFIVFGLAALFMASVGLYGVLSFSVSRRIQEMGIRMALGADARDVIKLVMSQGLVQIGIGLAIGLGMAFGLTNIISILMFGVDPRDPTVFGTVVLTIASVAIVASLVPAHRATRADPVDAMRSE